MSTDAALSLMFAATASALCILIAVGILDLPQEATP